MYTKQEREKTLLFRSSLEFVIGLKKIALRNLRNGALSGENDDKRKKMIVLLADGYIYVRF